MRIKWLGHSAFLIEGSKKIIIDPFITGNPKAPVKAEDIKADIVLVTHDHGDHLGDAYDITKKNNAVLVSIFEITQDAASKGVEKTEGGNIGGTIEIDGVKIHFTAAAHSSEGLGDPVGFIIEMDGKTIYHAGDTGLFSDMALYGEFFNIDVALLPIGDRFTMGPKSAAKAAKMLKAKKVIPMHWGTFPLLPGDPAEFAKLAECEVVILQPGESVEI